jgi:hypothetical protein
VSREAEAAGARGVHASMEPEENFKEQLALPALQSGFKPNLVQANSRHRVLALHPYKNVVPNHAAYSKKKTCYMEL